MSKILDGQLHPELLYRARRGRGRPAAMEVTTSSSALADALKGEEPTPGGEGREGNRHEEVSSVTVPSIVIAPPADKLILANGAELKRCDVYNKQFYILLFLSTKDAANSWLVRFAGRPDSRQRPDEQAVWKSITEKYLNSLMQQRRIIICKLNGVVMTPNQDPGEYFTKVFRHRWDELADIGKSFT